MNDEEKTSEADRYYQLGNQYRKQSDWQHALECYNQAIELDAFSPAVKAKEMIENILSYYCKQMYNP